MSSKKVLGVRIVAFALGLLLLAAGLHDLWPSTPFQAARSVGPVSQPVELPGDVVASLRHQPAISAAPTAGPDSLRYPLDTGQSALAGHFDRAASASVMTAGVYTDSHQTAGLTPTRFRRR